ncbi:MAG: hypothetical protein ACRDGM_04370 [bacterium]
MTPTEIRSHKLGFFQRLKQSREAAGLYWLEQLDELIEANQMGEVRYEIVNVSDGLKPETYVSRPIAVGEDRRAAAALEHFFTVDQIEFLESEKDRIRKLVQIQCDGIDQQIENLRAKKGKLRQILKFSATDANGEERSSAPTGMITPSEKLAQR